MLRKSYSFGVACQVLRALASADGTPDASTEMHTLANVAPVLQGGGTTRGLLLGALTAFGKHTAEISAAESLLLAAALRRRQLPLRLGD